MRAGRATAMSSPTPATSKCPNRPSCPSRCRPGLSRGCIKPRRPGPIPRHRSRPHNRCRTRRSPVRRAFSPLAPDNSRRWQRGRLLHELLRHLPALPVAGARSGSATLPCAAGARLDRRGDRALDRGGACRHRSAGPCRSVRRRLARRGAADRHVKTPRGTFTVSGQVDRLAVSPHEALIVDYKTNRPPPQSASGVALAYRRQLALYRALLAGIYPGRTIRAFLLWTAAPL